MVTEIQPVQARKVGIRASSKAFCNSDSRGLRNYASGLRAGLSLLLLAVVVLCGLAGCASSSNNSSSSTPTPAPAITSLSPTSGTVGTSVTITGTNFGATQSSSTVTFNGTAAAAASTWSATSIVVTVPAGATTGNVVVTVSAVASNGTTFTVLATPTITSLSVTSGIVGSSVTITGTNFGASQGTSTVTFNGTAAAAASTWTATSIVVLVPSGATTGNVVVTVSGLASNGSSFTVLVPPAITSLNKLTAAVNTNITITGTNFGATQGTSTVTFNGALAGTTSWSATSITATVPLGATTGNVVVKVGTLSSNGSPFTPGPSILSLNQNSGPVATVVIITGANFGATQGTSTVTFNGTPGVPTAWSATSITVPVPAAATTGNLTVTVATLPSNSATFTVGSSVTLSNCASSPTGDEAMLNGHYVFLVQGWSGIGLGSPVATVVSFNANGTGGITGGEGDANGQTNGAQHFTINSTGGLYKVGKDPATAGDIACVVLPTSLSTTATYTFSLGKLSAGVYTKGRIIRFDDTSGVGTRATGVLLKQTTPFGFPGASVNLAFGVSGWDATTKPFEGAGHFTMSTAGAFTNLSGDFNDAGAINFGLGAASPVSGASSNGGFAAAPDATAGYAQLAVHFTVSSSTANFNYAAYQVNTNEYFLISTDAISVNAPLASGRAIFTGSAFTNASVAGSYVVHQTGSAAGATAEVGLGLLTFTTGSPSGSIAGTLFQFQQGSSLGILSPAASYTTGAASGRVALTAASGFGTSSNIPIFYAATPNANTEPISAFAVGTDTDATFGLLETTPASGFTTAGLAGSYFFNTENPGDNTVGNQTGVVAITGALAACSGTVYGSDGTGLASGALGSCTIQVFDPSGFTDLGSGTVGIFNGQALFFFYEDDPISSTPAVIVEIEKQ